MPDAATPSEPPLPADLLSVRAVLGETLFAARVEQARERHRRFARAAEEIARGVPILQALGAAFEPGDVSRRRFQKWRKGGLWALVSRHTGAAKVAALSSRPDGSGLPRKQLALPLERPAGSLALTRRNRGLLRIPGTKASWVEELAARTPARFERYFEPFVGGGALFIYLEPPRAVLADLNAEFANLYTALRDTPAAVLFALAAYENTEECYYRARAVHPDSLSPPARAARTYFLNQTCFNGIYRVNAAGLFNVPYGNRARSDWLKQDFLWKVHRRLQGVELRSGDFDRGLDGCGPSDFAYLDPPYDLQPGAKVLAYQAAAFGTAEQERLAEQARRLDRQGAKFLLSNADTPRIRELYRGFEVERREVRRVVGGERARRGTAGEVLIRNYREREARGAP